MALSPVPQPSTGDAGFFAREAKRRGQMLAAADPYTMTADEREVLASEVTAFALVSLALTSLNPPARHRPKMPDETFSSRVRGVVREELAIRDQVTR